MLYFFTGGFTIKVKLRESKKIYNNNINNKKFPEFHFKPLRVFKKIFKGILNIFTTKNPQKIQLIIIKL